MVIVGCHDFDSLQCKIDKMNIHGLAKKQIRTKNKERQWYEQLQQGPTTLTLKSTNKCVQKGRRLDEKSQV